MRCPNCRAECYEEELYCPDCGADLSVTSKSIIPFQSNLPAVLHNPQLPKTVAAGVGALAFGVGVELLRRSLLTRLTQPSVRSLEPALPAINGLKDILFPRPEKSVKRPKKGYEIEETVVYMRRIIRQ